MKLVIAALLLILAGCAQNGGPRPSSTNFIPPPPPPEAAPLRAGPAPIGIGLPQVGRVTVPPPRRCKIKTQTVVQNGHKRVTKYRVCH